jgi:hypothetical protein
VSESLAENLDTVVRCIVIAMAGILVHGNNHYILSGPRPTEAEALELARHWSIVRIGEPVSSTFGAWEVRTKEFRENLHWAVVVPGERETSPGVVELLSEIAKRGITIQTYGRDGWK